MFLQIVFLKVFLVIFSVYFECWGEVRNLKTKYTVYRIRVHEQFAPGDAVVR